MKPSRNRREHAGALLVADIADFSLKDETEQVRLVEKLWRILLRHSLVRTKGRNALYNGTGDGVLMAFTGRALQYEPIVALGEELIDEMGHGQVRAGLRVGIHQGAFQVIRIPSLKIPQIAGEGPNTAARVAAIGGAGHIVLTEPYLEAWTQFAREEASKRVLAPRLGSHPSQVYVKHGVSIPVRVIRTPRSATTPPRLRNLQIVRDRIFATLRRVEDAVVVTVSEHDGSLDRRRLSVRISLLAPVAERKQSRPNQIVKRLAPGQCHSSLKLRTTPYITPHSPERPS